MGTLHRIYKLKNPETPDARPYSVIDVFLVCNNKATKQIEYIDQRTIFKEERYLEGKFFPLKKYPFAPIQIYGSSDPADYLDHYYGKKWRKKFIINPCHAFAKHKRGIGRDLGGIFVPPPLPKGSLLDCVEEPLRAKILEAVKRCRF